MKISLKEGQESDLINNNSNNQDQIQEEEKSIQGEMMQDVSFDEKDVMVKDLPKEEEMKDEEEDIQQKETDERILKQLGETREQYLQIIERINIHKNILKEIFEHEESKQLESKDQVKSSKKILLENQIKLEKLILGLDSLIGASEKVRPEKKKLVNEINSCINEIDKIASGELKSLESKIEQLVLKKQQEQKEIEEQRKQQEEKEKKEEISQQKPEIENKMEEEEEDEENEEEQETSPISNQPQTKVETPKISSPVSSFPKQIPVINKDEDEEKDEEESFPFPSKKDWEKLTFEPKFNIQQFRDRYVISSNIPNMDTKDINIRANDNILTIEGIKYPTEEEKHLLAKKLLQSLRNPYILKSIPREQIASAILRIASDYNFGKFSVKYELPSNTEEDIKATYKNDILQIELPVKQKAYYPSFHQQRYSPEVPFYGNKYRRPNNFWDFF